ncbi:DUF802 domain-containing protein [Hydrogenophaga sp. BPS33]|uniref:DUF802 domain-containing protein n=1 Tax=Hydrogenophaga sp. BPS33 TaxID=2651974 RepID=UPI00131F769B|nr:DUF802 domain-containing protein [Hydrogenophaga sp. BPS33]QHE84941.1 DUF802 domain-containing protein [Hydrogenophaga sp. BPS33]
MSRNAQHRIFLTAAFVLGLLAILWVGWGFVGTSALALLMTAFIAIVYLVGAHEIRRYRQATAALAQALTQVPQPLQRLDDWLVQVPAAMQNAVRQRIEGERGALPGLALTPYLIGLLVMLGMLGTFLGMVVTFKGVLFTLEGSADLEAIRAALASPIKGLGLAFGTSVVGVATSAMLGLMSAIARRERAHAVRELDARIATALRPFSLVHQRQETFSALQQQASALPAVATQLQALMEQIDRRNQQLDEQLLSRQTQFHREASEAYTQLASSVERTLKDSLSASAREAGATLQPVMENAMNAIARESTRLHERVSEAVQAQMGALNERFAATASTVADGWATALQQHAQTGEQQAQGLERALNSFTTRFEERCAALIDGVQASVTRTQAEQVGLDQQRVAAWTQALQDNARQGEQQVQGLDRALNAFTSAFEERCAALITGVQESVSRTHAEQSGMEQQKHLAWTEALQTTASALQAEWRQAGAQMLAQQQSAAQALEQTARQWRDELATLRSEEAARGQAAVQRLGELQSSLNEQVSTHLVTLGTALEAPITRLLDSAADAPKAAAEVIAQLRQDMSQLTERDNLALQERTSLMQNIDALVQGVQQAAAEQRAAVESLVSSAGSVLEQVGRQFAESVGTQAVRAEEVATQVQGSTIELAALGEAFGHAVELFCSTNEKLIESLQRVEGTVSQSVARSDEQLNYYVAQAREVIDLSITSQQGILEDMHRLHRQATAKAEGEVGATP